MTNVITREDIINVLMRFGCDFPLIENNDTMIFNSICHTLDNNKKKLYCYNNNGKFLFFCYICGFSGDIFALISHLTKCDFNDAQIIFKQSRGKSFNSQKSIQINLEEETKIKKAELVVRDKQILNRYRSDLFYQGWIDEHISIETMKVFNIRTDVNEECIILPHYDISDNLVGIRKRNLNKQTIENSSKYMPVFIGNVSYSHPLSENLYGLNITKPFIEKSHTLYIFESEKSVMQMYSYGYCTSVAICGGFLSNTHVELIKSLKVNRICICMDRDWTDRQDFKYEIFKKKIEKMINKLSTVCKQIMYIDKQMEFLLDIKDSPSDKGKTTFESLLSFATRISTSEMERENENE